MEASARALLAEAVRLSSLGCTNKAIALCNEMLTIYGLATEPAFHDLVDQNLLQNLAALGPRNGGGAAYDILLGRLAGRPEQMVHRIP